MRRKTWILLKRGLLDPKHRDKLGVRVWLYLFMIDQADWKSGKIFDWTDQAAADELVMPVTTLRKQRRQLEEAEYITCEKNKHSQTITVHKWVNPREYSGEIYNPQGVTKSGHPHPDMGVTETGQSSGESSKSDHKSDHKPIQRLVTPSIPPHVINHESLTSEPKGSSGEPDPADASNSVFYAIAKYIFGVSPDEIPKASRQLIARDEKALNEINGGVEPQDIEQFEAWWRRKYEDADLPRDPAKLQMHFLAFKTSASSGDYVHPDWRDA